MDLKMEVYTPGLELLGTLEIYEPVMWEDRAFGAGSFSLSSLISEESRQLLVPDNIIWVTGTVAGVIEHIEQTIGDEGPYITVKGRLLTGLLDRRILWGTYNMYGEAPALMCELVTDCAITPTRGDDTAARIIPGLAIPGEVPTTGSSIRKQKTGGGLLDALAELGEANQVAFGVAFNAAVPSMDYWVRPGVDRSVNQTVNEPVFFSTELDDVLSSEYYYDASDYRTIALVGGEDTDAGRAFVTVTGSDAQTAATVLSASGFDRREMFVDARDLQSDADPDAPLTEEEYAGTLATRGREKLADAQLVRSFSAVVRTDNATYEYGTDYLLGDTITVTDERLGVSVDAIVEAVEWAVSRMGTSLTLTLGYGQPTITDLIRRGAGK